MQSTKPAEFENCFRSQQEDMSLDISIIANPTLARLLAEVKSDERNTMGAYDRAHNRHNRS